MAIGAREETHDLEALDEHVRVCIGVFVALIGLTFITVVVSYLKLPTPATITVALCIALVKGSMGVSFFMHLISEKKLVYYALIVTAVFFLFLMILPILTEEDPVTHTIRLTY